jgi:hypothetical protein
VGLSLKDADVVLATLGRGEQHGVGGGGGGDRPSAELADRLRRSVGWCWSRGGVGIASRPMSLATMQGLLAGDVPSFPRSTAAGAAASSPRRSAVSPPSELFAQRRRRRKSSAKEDCGSFAMRVTGTGVSQRLKARSGMAWSEEGNVGWLFVGFELRVEGRRRK